MLFVIKRPLISILEKMAIMIWIRWLLFLEVKEKDIDKEYTEAGMNGFSQDELRE